MRRPRTYRPIDFRQTCAIVRAVYHRDQPTDDATWKEAAKLTCASQGYDEPSSDLLARALSAVSRVLANEGYVRPSPPTPARPVAPAVAPITRAEAAQILRRLGVADLVKRVPSVRPRSRREVEVHKAASIVAQAIVEQVERCEAAERAVEDRDE